MAETPLVHFPSGPSGGDTLKVESGGFIRIISGGIIAAGTATTGASSIAALATTATLADANLQATNAAINSIKTALVNVGIVTST